MPHKHKPLLNQKHLKPIYSKRSNHRMNTDHNNRISHKFNQNLCKTMFCINLFHFTRCGQICDSSYAVAKSAAEPRNSNDLYTANNSALCAFFIRSLRTSKTCLACSSMVACSGKGFALCCVRVSQFSSPLHVTAQASKLCAVTLKIFYTEFTQ